MPSLASKAHRKVGEALWAGKLVVPDSCELWDNTLHYSHAAHHWNGYDNPLDIWWICRSCNRRLVGEYFHSGKVSKEQARNQIRMMRIAAGELIDVCKQES